MDCRAVGVGFFRFIIFHLSSYSTSHPLHLIFLLLIFFFYRCLPGLFFFFFRSSPVILCALFLLKLLFIFDGNIVDGKKKNEIGGLRKEVAENLMVESSLSDEKGREVLGVSNFGFFNELGGASEIDLVKRNEYGECIRDEGEKDDGIHKRGDDMISMACTVGSEKNGMDLGASAIERIKRLESMITKRRERKPMELYDGDMVVPLSLLRHKDLSILTSSDTGSPAPGSAPSMLLPKHNPFDLPYDQYEEKPNLRGEFMESCHKDVQFCRHESFCFGGSIYGGSMDSRGRNGFHSFKFFQEKEGNGPELGFQLGRVDCEEEFEQGSSSYHNNRTSHELDSETEIDTSLINVDDSFEMPAHAVDEDPKSPASTTGVSGHPDSKTATFSADFCSSDAADVKYDSTSGVRTGSLLCSYMEMRGHHTPEESIASDLQVEISEPGSPSQVTAEDETEGGEETEDCGLDLRGVSFSSVEGGHLIMGTSSKTSFMEKCGYVASPKQNMTTSTVIGTRVYDSRSSDSVGGYGRGSDSVRDP